MEEVARGLSAGRVQSVAVRLIVEREEEIKKFNPEEYWDIEAELKRKGDTPKEKFKASLEKYQDKPVDLTKHAEAEKAVAYLKKANYVVITTCMIRESAENRVYGMVNNLIPLKEKKRKAGKLENRNSKSI